MNKHRPQLSEEWTVMVMQASNRNMPWIEMLSELLDNALQFRSPGEPMTFDVVWDVRGRKFSATDNGIGDDDPTLVKFMEPGTSGGWIQADGASTFGTGLFAVECNLQAVMTIYTKMDGQKVRVGRREVRHGLEWSSRSRSRHSRLSVAGHGTQVLFEGVKAVFPRWSSIEQCAEQLADMYQMALKNHDVSIRLRRIDSAGEMQSIDVYPSNEVEIEGDRQWEAEELIDGNAYLISWRNTQEQQPSGGGAFLHYGGKKICAAPVCGTYRTEFFQADIILPKRLGRNVMDLLKRNVEHSEMEEIYGICESLFEPALKHSDARIANETERELNRTIEKLLVLGTSVRGGDVTPPNEFPPQPPPPPGPCLHKHVRGEDCQCIHPGCKKSMHKYNDGDRCIFCGKIKKRITRRQKSEGNSIRVRWLDMPADKRFATFEKSQRVLTFNEDVPFMRDLKRQQDSERLALLGICAMACHRQAFPHFYSDQTIKGEHAFHVAFQEFYELMEAVKSQL